MSPFDAEKELLPDYPRTRHLPYRPNASRDDLIASEKEAQVIFGANTTLEEKVDGANLGVYWSEEGPVIRNRSHILRKGYRKNTPAKMQFSSTWSWMYEQKEKFLALQDLIGNVSVYGEWLFAQHSIAYTSLPSLFLTFDLFDHHEKRFIDAIKARSALQASGFEVCPLLQTGIKNYKELDNLLEAPSLFAPSKREGVYLKVSDGNWITHRFKIVRHDFIAGEHWSDSHLTKNQVRKR